MNKYGSFCPIAKAAEILTERWTLLVLRDLLQGSRHFSDMRRGVPLMSPTLLSKRIQTLEAAGLICRSASSTRGHWEYHPTEAARELEKIIESIGHWGQKWARSKLTPDELDPGALMWFMHRHFAIDQIPSDFVLYVEISDVKQLKKWWFVVDHGEMDLCWDDPGREVSVSVYATLLTLTQVFMGDLSLIKARSLGKIEIDGPKAVVSAMPNWFPRSKFADDNPVLVCQ